MPDYFIGQTFRDHSFQSCRVGGIVATDRHGTHAAHGKDLVIVQASHVGYEPETNKFGAYRRMCTDGHKVTSSCGKLEHIMGWYQKEYNFARKNI